MMQILSIGGSEIREHYEAPRLKQWMPNPRAQTQIDDLSVSFISAASAFLPQKEQSTTARESPCSNVFSVSYLLSLAPEIRMHEESMPWCRAKNLHVTYYRSRVSRI